MERREAVVAKLGQLQGEVQGLIEFLQDEARAQLEETNLDIAAAAQQVEVAEMQLRQARTVIYPTLSLDAVYTLNDDQVSFGGGNPYTPLEPYITAVYDEFGEARVIDTPITEMGFAGIATGAAYKDLKPICEFMTFNFAMQAIDQIVNSAAKQAYMTNGDFGCPIVFRGPNGAAAGVAAQHSQCFAAWYSQCPGLKVVMPYDAEDARGLLKAAIRDPDPVLFMESELAYGIKGEVPDEEYLIPLGKADLKRDGTDVTLVTYNKQLFNCLDAAKVLEEKHGISAQVLDLRTIRPLDEQALYDCVSKTHRMVVVQEGFPFAGVAAEIAARVSEACFDALDAPVLRVTNLDVNQPYATNLEKLVMPSVDRIVEAARTVCSR